MSDMVLEKLHEILSDQLEQPLLQRSRQTRADEAIDGLEICGPNALEFVRQKSVDESTPGEIAAMFQIADRYDEPLMISSIMDATNKNRECWMGIRLGLRICRISKFRDWLDQLLLGSDPVSAAVALDVLLFHRQAVRFDPVVLLMLEDPEIRCVTLGALGRSNDGEQKHAIRSSLDDSDPVVRREALRAAARSGRNGLKMKCKEMATSNSPCLNAVRFLGVLCDESDFAFLRQLATSETTASAAIEAMGILGASELIPDILKAIASPLTNQAAANSIERIGGRSIPRSDPPDPPEGLTEEELDFWFHPGDPIPEQAERWWKQNSFLYEQGKRYQAGRCVSDDPLGPVFDELPDEVRRDVYLRQRALDFQNTPDWELETWPTYMKNPAWCFENSTNPK